MQIRPARPSDAPCLIRLWNQSAEAGEVVFKPMTNQLFLQTYFQPSYYNPAYLLAALEGETVVGFIAGICQDAFLPGETHENTPAYLSVIFVEKSRRRQGIGSALMDALAKAFCLAGKKRIALNDMNPVKLSWFIPGAAPHDHNNAPGVDEACSGFPFLIKNGFTHVASDIAMYLNLKDYAMPPEIEEKRRRLLDEGIATGRYDVSLRYEFDGMCDRVGSEYWRKVLQDETAREHPRPILAATVPGHIVAFTGPVDKQESGRGWFTGICTDPLYEKKGIATVLFNLLMQEFVDEGASFSTLFTGSENHAQRIYLRAGFRIVRRFAVMSKDIGL